MFLVLLNVHTQEDLIEKFQQLKQLVIQKYQERYPYVPLDWQKFSSKDILQLIDDIEQKTKQRISEKWIYTHLKPLVNEKLPRKDMLDILSMYSGVEAWDAFIAVNKGEIASVYKANNKKKVMVFVSCCLLLLILGISYFYRSKPNAVAKSIVVKDFYTGEVIADSTIKIYEDNSEDGLNRVVSSENIIHPTSKLVVESPFYENTEVLTDNESHTVFVKPIDNAMILKGYLKADLTDWNTRKEKLNKILSDELEVLLHLPNQLGIEYLNKEEFAQKLIVPNSKIKRWEIIEIVQNELNQITKIRIKQ